jgi:hypothetical protein
MYAAGRNELLRRNIPWLKGTERAVRAAHGTGKGKERCTCTGLRAGGRLVGSGQNIDEFISAGYNYPVSVKHLHVHMMVPPFKHNKILQYPRWHPHSKVIDDLKRLGKVQIYEQNPNETAVRARTPALPLRSRLSSHLCCCRCVGQSRI